MYSTEKHMKGLSACSELFFTRTTTTILLTLLKNYKRKKITVSREQPLGGPAARVPTGRTFYFPIYSALQKWSPA